MISSRNIAWIHIHLLPHFSNWVSEYLGHQIKEVFDILKIIENHTKVKVDNINLKKLLRYQILTLVQLVDDYRRL